MALVDILVLATLVITLVLGFVKGFVPQVVGIGGILGGVYLASRYHEGVREKLLDPRIATGHNGTIAFVGIIVLTVLGVALLGFLFAKMVNRLQLSPYDRLMGGAFGALKGALICAGLLLALVYFAPNGGEIERAIGRSRAGPVLWRAMSKVAEWLPTRVRPGIEEFLHENTLPEPPPPPSAPLESGE